MDARSTIAATTTPTAGLYHGWLVVAVAFLIAVFSWGLGFYGLGIYLVALRERFGWSAADIATAITVYYIVGAALTFLLVGPAFERYGVRRVVAAGTLAMAAAVTALPLATALWHVHAIFALMSIGWAAMSGAAVNIIVAPWFDRRRGLAVSVALNGASAGGLIMAPLLIFLIDRFGFATALTFASLLMLAVLLPLLLLIMREKRPDEHDRHDDPRVVPIAAQSAPAAPPWSARKILRDRDFLTISIPFALGLTAQVGFLTHQVAFLTPMTGAVTAGWIVSLTTVAAIVGRLGTGLFVDRVDRRVVSCLNFLLQTVAMATLMSTTVPALLVVGCLLFGLGLGNLTSLPPLIVQQEFPKRDFARIASMIVGINQFAFAFGPVLLGWLQKPDGAYTYALFACLVMQVLGAVIVLAPVLGRSKGSHQAVCSAGREPR
ncbi:MAG TPA: MFS transporter [Xanthobacteraceae bacterium]|nr:MFS transporter [Xanthobacteraceae bacterium]